VRHEQSRKHLQKVKEKQTECETCGKGYGSVSGLWKHQQKCASELKTLLAEQRRQYDEQRKQHDEQRRQHDEQRRQHDELIEEMRQQKQRLVEIAATPTTKTTNNVLVFLNTDCSNAMNWADFVAGLTVELEGDMTESIVKTVCTAIQELGMHRRPIHCVDVKRRKLYLKTNNVWENDAGKIETAMKESHTVLQNQCRSMLQAWDTIHPNWDKNDAEMERYRKLVVQVTDGVDEERCTTAISKKVGISK
jgi:hypothetical protein